MKRIDGKPIKSILVLVCLLTLSWLFGSVAAKADVVLDWNAIAVSTAIANGQNPVAQTRFGTIAQLAVFEAVECHH